MTVRAVALIDGYRAFALRVEKPQKVRASLLAMLKRLLVPGHDARSPRQPGPRADPPAADRSDHAAHAPVAPPGDKAAGAPPRSARKERSAQEPDSAQPAATRSPMRTARPGPEGRAG
jgi:hypothetical protein